MFTVRGWAVTADKLKPEEALKPATGAGQVSKPKKRKRAGRVARTEVTADNVADLWREFIEGAGKSGNGQNEKTKFHKDRKGKEKVGFPHKDGEDEDADSRPRKQRKKEKKYEREKRLKGPHMEENPVQALPQPGADANKDEEWGELSEERTSQSPQKRPTRGEPDFKSLMRRKDEGSKTGEDTSERKLKKDKKDKQAAKDAPAQPSTPSPTVAAAASETPTQPTAKVTALQASMREKLISARFRYLNETLYTCHSSEAFALFRDSPEMFSEYHEGFRRQVDVWPENPVNGYIAEIKARAKVGDASRAPQHIRQQRSKQRREESRAVLPLPRHILGSCTVADLGCGDAALATSLQPLAKKLRLEIKSFDLQSPSPLVTRADVAKLPLPAGSVDVAIFCLALMGTNWTAFIEEAYRVLRWKGELWVAEIKSRFAGPGRRGIVEHGGGAWLKIPAQAKKNDERRAYEATQLAVEVDGIEDQQRETDVSAFVEVLRKRGFVLRGGPDEAVDMSNRMFVKMYFVKGAPAFKGKCAVQQMQKRGDGLRAPKTKTRKFSQGEEEQGGEEANEAAVLRPCLYKLR